MNSILGFAFLFSFGCVGSYNTDGGDYLADQMVEYGCLASSPCNFLAHDGPGVYTCTGSYPDSSTVADEFGSPNPFLDREDSTRPHYIIYSDGTGEPDADANYNDLFPPKADPRMLALQKRGEELGCRTVNADVYDVPRGSEGWERWETPQYSCRISTCEAWVEKGEVHVRKKADLPNGA